MLKGYYLPKEDTGERVLVGYKVKSLDELESMGYRISRTAIEDFTKARKEERGAASANENTMQAKK